MAHKKKRRTEKKQPLSLEERIALLTLPERTKELYRLILRHDALGDFGFITTTAFTGRQRLATLSLPAFLTGWLYYFLCGMWRKGLSLLGLWICYLAILWFSSIPLSLMLFYLPNLIIATMAVGDTYRHRVLQEEFWL